MSGQDGGVGRYTVPPHTTKTRRTTNLKTNNCQKIELYRSLTTKELVKKHLSRWVAGAEMDSQVRGLVARQWLEDWNGQGGGWRIRWSHFHMWKNWKEQLGSKTD